jgi:hypothetical protein
MDCDRSRHTEPVAPGGLSTKKEMQSRWREELGLHGSRSNAACRGKTHRTEGPCRAGGLGRSIYKEGCAEPLGREENLRSIYEERGAEPLGRRENLRVEAEEAASQEDDENDAAPGEAGLGKLRLREAPHCSCKRLSVTHLQSLRLGSAAVARRYPAASLCLTAPSQTPRQPCGASACQCRPSGGLAGVSAAQPNEFTAPVCVLHFKLPVSIHAHKWDEESADRNSIRPPWWHPARYWKLSSITVFHSQGDKATGMHPQETKPGTSAALTRATKSVRLATDTERLGISIGLSSKPPASLRMRSTPAMYVLRPPYLGKVPLRMELGQGSEDPGERSCYQWFLESFQEVRRMMGTD